MAPVEIPKSLDESVAYLPATQAVQLVEPFSALEPIEHSVPGGVSIEEAMEKERRLRNGADRAKEVQGKSRL